MRYILQMHTGSFQRCQTTPEQAVATVNRLLDALDVKAVIWGWATERAVNEAVCDALVQAGVERYLWLPVFAEAANPALSEPFVFWQGARGAAIDLVQGESFDFACPSSLTNIRNALDTYAQIADGLRFSGVFLDRIRYPSAANSPQALAGCWCENCRARYERFGVQRDDLAKGMERDADFWLPTDRERGVYRFADERAQRLFDAKRAVITDAVRELCAYFHARGLKVGIDTFAPAVADYVGQDVFALTAMTDFCKPMMYRQTTAPAGVSFERDAIKKACGARAAERLSRLWGGDLLSREGNAAQMRELQSCAGNVAPGIETHAVPGVCTATEDYVLQSLSDARDAGCQSAVLSWNVLLTPESMIRAIATSR